MLKKILTSGIVITLILGMTGCGRESKKPAAADMNNRGEITVYLPEGTDIDNKYKDDKSVAINYLPGVKDKYSSKDVDKIADNIDKNVKVLIINSDNEGLLPVFKKVKAKLPGVITIGAQMKEMNTEAIDRMLLSENINVGFKIDENLNARLSAQLAKQMGAKEFIYVYEKESLNKKLYEDMNTAKQYCDSNGVRFSSVEVNDSDFDKKISPMVSGKNDVAVYPSSEKLSESVLKGALKYRYILPGINSDNDGKLLADTLNLKKQYEEKDVSGFDKEVSKKLKTLNMDNRIAGISESRNCVPTEIAIEIAHYMYDHNYMIEECYRDYGLNIVSNRSVNMKVYPYDIGVSSGYMRKLQLTPRIY